MNWSDTKCHIYDLVAADIEHGELHEKPQTKRVWRTITTSTGVDIDIEILGWNEGGWASDDRICDYAHEFAEGAAWVIYRDQSRALWADSWEISDYEDAYGYNGDQSIDDNITTCVYLATREAVQQAVQDIRDEMEA